MKTNVMRLVSWLLVIAMLAAMPVAAFAADEHEHTFESETVTVTCSADGYTRLTCTDCGYTTKSEVIPAHHNYDEGTYHEGEDDELGYIIYKCVDCGHSKKALDHDHVYTEVVHAATCVRNGYITYGCTACEYTYKVFDTDAATGHDFGEWTVTKSATSTKKGVESRTCKNCGEVETRPTDREAPSSQTATITGAEVVKVYKEASTSADVAGIALKGSKFNLEARDPEKKWARIGADMWVPMANVSVDSSKLVTSAYAGATYYGFVQNSVQLKVRTGPSSLSALVSSLGGGTEIAIFSTSWDSNSVQWGRISKTEEKWVELTNVTVYKIIKGTLPDGNTDSGSSSDKPVTPAPVGDKVIATGTVNSTINLNVRKSASVSVLNLLGSLANGTKVEIYETKDVSGHAWGRIDYKGSKGWICLDYVTLDKGSSIGTGTSGTGTAAATPNATVVNCSTGVNVRSKSAVTGNLVSVIPVNTRIAITKLSNGWGYVDGKGWVYLDYVKLDDGAEAAIKSGNTGSNPTGTTVEKPLPTYTNVTVPAVVMSDADVYDKASSDATVSKKLITMNADPDKVIEISDRTRDAGGKQWGKVTVGSIVGWVDMTNLSTMEVSGTVSTENTKVYEEMTVDGEVVTTLGKGTAVTIKKDNQSTDGTYVWGFVKGLNGYIQLNKVALTYTKSTGSDAGIIAVSITGKTATDSVALRKSPNSTTVLLTLEKGTPISVTGWKLDGGAVWGKTSVGQYSGWIDVADLEQDAVEGTVTADSINLYNDYTGGTVELILRSGEKVKVLQRMLYGTSVWGRVQINKKDYWGNMASITLAGQEQAAPSTPTTPSVPEATPVNPSTPAVSTTATGTVVNADKVNVRSAAGVSNPLVTSLAKGTKVTVYEQTTVDNALWGRIDQGWIAMNYVDLSTKTNANGTTSGTILTTVPAGAIAVGFVNTADLAVRATPNGTKTGTLPKSANVVITETQMKDGMNWAHVEGGWVSTTYLTLTGTSVTGSGTAGTVKGCFYTANLRSAPGVSNALVGKIMVNSRVEILEQQIYSGEYWGRTSAGWIAMQYVLTGSVPVV